MLIISRVCAEFRNPKTGVYIFSITPANRFVIMEAPEAIRMDPLYQLLVNEGSLEAVVSASQRMQLEGDPTFGVDATGKKIAPAKSGGKKSSSNKAAKTETAEAKPAPVVVSVTNDDAAKTAQTVPEADVSEQ